MQLSENESKMLEKFANYVANNHISNDCLVQFIELAGSYLNLQTISDYAKSNKLSYNGVKNNRQIINIFNVKFVIDND